MLYYLLYEQLYRLGGAFTPFRVFRYTTFRTAFASLTALFLCIVLGPWLINKLRQFQIGQYIREEGPKSHQKKAGTPTMGGALIIVSIAITTILWGDLENRFVWVVLLVMLGFGAIGWVDDYRKVVHRNPKGLSARSKFLWQSVIGLMAAFYLAFSVSAPTNSRLASTYWPERSLSTLAIEYD